MNNKIETGANAKSLGYLAIVPLLGAVYYILNRPGQMAQSTYTVFDDYIPFVGVFIIPYMIWMPFILITLVYFCLRHRELYNKVLILYAINVLVCYVIYYFYQTTVPRPEIIGGGLIHDFVRWVYVQDEPFNCFPSIHVLTSYLMFVHAARHPSMAMKAKISISLLAFFIIISTLLVKQHSVLDAIGGVAMVEFSYRIKGFLSNGL